MNAEGGVTRPAGVNSEFPLNNLAANPYKPGELFRRFHLQNAEKNSFSEENTEEVDNASDNLSVESDNQADLLDQAEVIELPETITKRKASSDLNIRQPKSSYKNPGSQGMDSGTSGT